MYISNIFVICNDFSQELQLATQVLKFKFYL